MPIRSIAAITAFLTCVGADAAEQPFVLRDGDRVVFLGNALFEHERQHGYLEVALRRSFPRAKVVFRNLGWSGDTIQGNARTSGYQNPEGMARLLKEVKAHKPTVLFIAYGMNESFAGDAGLPTFQKGYAKLLADVAGLKARVVLLSPTWHEPLPSPAPDAASHNRNLKMYTDAIRDLAQKHGADFVDLFDWLASVKSKHPDRSLTSNGILLNEWGYWTLARAVATTLRLDDESVVIESVPGKPLAWRRMASAPRPGSTTETVILVVRGLPPGRHVVALQGQRLAAGTDQEWNAGIRVSASPFIEDVESFRGAIVRRDDLFHRGWRPFNDHSRHWHFMAKDFQLFNDMVLRQDEAIDASLEGRLPSLEVTPEKSK